MEIDRLCDILQTMKQNQPKTILSHFGALSDHSGSAALCAFLLCTFLLFVFGIDFIYVWAIFREIWFVEVVASANALMIFNWSCGWGRTSGGGVRSG